MQNLSPSLYEIVNLPLAQLELDPPVTQPQTVSVSRNPRLFKVKETLEDIALQKEMSVWISHLNGIRIIVPQGRGYGNQSACLTVLNRIRQLGYLGDVQFVYDGVGIQRRMHMLLQGQEKKLGPFTETDCSTYDYEYGSNFPPVDIAIIPSDEVIIGEDYCTYCAKWNAAATVLTKPTFWNGGAETVSVLGEKQVDFDGVDNKNGALYAVPPASYDINQSIDEASQDNQISAKTAKFLRELLVLKQTDRIHLQFIYGLYDRERQREFGREEVYANYNATPQPGIDIKDEVNRLSEALEKVFEPTSSKPVLIVSLQSIPFFGLNSHLTAHNTLDDIFNPLEKGVHLFCCSDLPPTLFHALLCEGGTIPPVVEGANATSLLEASGRPYLHGGRPRSRPPLRDGDENFLAIQKLHLNASMYLELQAGAPEGFNDLAAFLRVPQKDKIHYFITRKVQFEKTMYEKLFTSLWHIKEVSILPENKRFEVLFNDTLEKVQKAKTLFSFMYPALKRLQSFAVNSAQKEKVRDLAKKCLELEIVEHLVRDKDLAFVRSISTMPTI